MTTISSIIKKSFLENFDSNAITPRVVAISLAIIVVLSLYLFLVYRLVSKNTLYNRDFNISLVGMAVVTGAIVLAIQSNLVLSLGMVGALSIVRYRSAVKNPMDLFFLFWAIANGIMCGARQYALALSITIILSVILFLLASIPVNKPPFILVINGTPDDIDEIKLIVKSHCSFSKVKSNYMSGNKLRMILEIKTKKRDDLLKTLCKMDNVSASILHYDGNIA